MAKNPFEIRADIMAMAKDYLDKQTALNVQYWEKMFSLSGNNIKEMETAYTAYSMEELLAKAQEMYSFVSKKD